MLVVNKGDYLVPKGHVVKGIRGELVFTAKFREDQS